MKNLSLACAFAATAMSIGLPSQAWSEDAPPAPSADAAQQPPAPPKPESAPVAVPAPSADVQTNAAVKAEPTVRRVSPTTSAEEALVSMNFDETPLTDVIKAFREATGANIISSGTNLQGTVSVRLDNVPWRKGLGSILEPQGLQLTEQPLNSGIFLVTAKSVEIPLVTQTFSLDCAKADDVAKLFNSILGKNGTATPFPSANVVIVTSTPSTSASASASRLIRSAIT